MALLHKNLFASKWVQALGMAFGASFSADSSFALLYVMYNPVCRRDVLKKNRTANKMLAEALYPVYKEYSGDTHHLGFYIKSAWAFIKFVVKNRSLADCNPLMVLEASQQPHAVLFKDVNRLLMLVEHYKQQPEAVATSADHTYSHNFAVVKLARGLKRSSVISLGDHPQSDHENSNTSSLPNTARRVSWLQRIQNILKRSNKVAPSSPGNFQRYGDAPKLFVDEFETKRQFVSDNIDEEARLSLLTIMLFPNAGDFGSSSDCKQYLHQFLENLDSFRKLFGAMLRLTQDLEDADSAEKRRFLSRKERLVRRVSDLIFGEDMKLLRNFHSLSEEEAMKLYKLHDFPDLDLDDFKVPSVTEVLKQLLTADKTTPFQKKSGISPQIQESEDGSHALEPVIQHLHTSGPPQVNSVPFDGSDHQVVAGVSATGLGRSRPTMYTTKNLLVAAAKESAGLGDPQAITLNQSNELATIRSEETHNLLRKYQDQAQKLRADIQLQRFLLENLNKRAEAAEALLQALKDLHAASQVAPLAAGPLVEGKSSEADTKPNTHHDSGIKLTNENAEVAVAARDFARLHIKSVLQVPHD
jgi:hypothetical protein